MQNIPGSSSSAASIFSVAPHERVSGRHNSAPNTRQTLSMGAFGRIDSDAAGPSKIKRKSKTARACNHCQRSHLTCDDARPCRRCTKRGYADTCEDGNRKKAKYLLEDEDIEAHHSSAESDARAGKKSDEVPSRSSALAPPSGSNDFDSFMDGVSFDHPYEFGSQMANLEYSVLSSMLGNTGLDAQSDEEVPPKQSLPSPQDRGEVSSWSSNLAASGMPFPNTPAIFRRNRLTPEPSSSDSFYTQEPTRPFDSSLEQPDQFQGHIQNAPMAESGPRLGGHEIAYLLNPIAPLSPPMSDSNPVSQEHSRASTPFADFDMLGASNLTTVPLGLGDEGNADADIEEESMWLHPGDDVYATVTTGFDYTRGYHFLMRYLKERLGKDDILRVVRALAIFRPSLIALQTQMTAEDEIFVEQGLQRSLLDLRELIAYTGTPTAVWRRTGEICEVGLEFAMLSGWPRESLVGCGKFIYELFETQSTVEYWENFASHAFESSSQSVHTHCVLLKPSGESVPCSFCFTIRRNMFHLPDLIIGQWLPLF